MYIHGERINFHNEKKMKKNVYQPMWMFIIHEKKTVMISRLFSKVGHK